MEDVVKNMGVTFKVLQIELKFTVKKTHKKKIIILQCGIHIHYILNVL